MGGKAGRSVGTLCAIAQQYRHGVAPQVGCDQIGPAIAIDIGAGHAIRGVPNSEIGLGGKAARTIAQQHRHESSTATPVVGRDQIDKAIAIDIGAGDGKAA